MELSRFFDQFPAFHQWVKDKKLTLKDLTILTEFKDSSSLKPLLEWIELCKPTHSEGMQILELGGELLLMNKSLDSLLFKEQKAFSLIECLKKLRQPETSSRDERKSKIINSLGWTDSIKAKWIRQNDRGALSISFNSFSLRDFKQKIQKLDSIYDQLNEGSEKLWKDG